MSEQVVLKSNVKDTGLEAVRESIAAKGAGSPYTQDLNHKQEEIGGRGGDCSSCPRQTEGQVGARRETHPTEEGEGPGAETGVSRGGTQGVGGKVPQARCRLLGARCDKMKRPERKQPHILKE